MAIASLGTPKHVPSGEELDQIVKVLTDASRSLEGSREALCELLDKFPFLSEIHGDMARRAETSLVQVAADGNILIEESTRQQLAIMRKNLAATGDGALERLLVERVTLCWLAVNSAECRRAERQDTAAEGAAFWDKHVSRLHSDFLKACRTLALVRRLLRPAVTQVNIAANQQVNVVEPGEQAL